MQVCFDLIATVRGICEAPSWRHTADLWPALELTVLEMSELVRLDERG